ncbi:MAG: hypothetical protein KAQ74_01210 [Dehalococcoidia bacterium]|nr:hypothetical protein [Dehalococcoidia bacterium]
MLYSKLARFLSVTLCVFLLGAAVAGPVAVLAADGDAEPIQDKLVANAKFPAMTGSADSTFKYEVQFTFTTDKPSGDDFDLTVGAPPNWIAYVAESAYALDSQIASIHLERFSVLESVIVVVVAPFWLYPEPGDYPIEFTATSADVEEAVTLTATITARYAIDADTTTGRLNTKTTAGNPAVFNVKVTNNGTAIMDKVSFTSSTPAGIGNEQWVVKYAPETLENLGPGEETEVEVSITPPEQTIAGDYMVTLKFGGEPELSSRPPELDIRVSVEKKTAWGIIGAVIVVAVIGGLVWGFREFGRK